jgi:hypothetical protein
MLTTLGSHCEIVPAIPKRRVPLNHQIGFDPQHLVDCREFEFAPARQVKFRVPTPVDSEMVDDAPRCCGHAAACRQGSSLIALAFVCSHVAAALVLLVGTRQAALIGFQQVTFLVGAATRVAGIDGPAAGE